MHARPCRPQSSPQLLCSTTTSASTSTPIPTMAWPPTTRPVGRTRHPSVTSTMPWYQFRPNTTGPCWESVASTSSIPNAHRYSIRNPRSAVAFAPASTLVPS